MSTKPLIFVYPLSETIKKLKEEVDKISEEEGIEIFEVDDMQEIVQLVASIGQSLTIFANPKKCATSLKATRKILSKLNSKTLLLSEKQLPRKTLDKFSKIGLTEFIKEPVAPKTLLYKVKLQLKSIVASDGQEEEEDDQAFSLANDDEENIDKNEQQRVEKGLASDEESVDYSKKKSEKSEVQFEDIYAEEEKKKSNYQEDNIDTHWAGKDKAALDLSAEEDEDEEKKKYEEEDIETYYKGKTATTQLEMADEYDKKKSDSQEDDEEDIYGTKKKQQQLDIGDDLSPKKEKKEDEDLEEEDFSRKKRAMLDLEAADDYRKNKEDEEELDEDNEARKKESLLDLEADDDDELKNNEVDMNLEEEKKEKDQDMHDLDALSDDEEKKKQEENVLDIEKEKKDIDLEEDEEEKERKRRALLELEEEKGNKKDENDEEELDENGKNKNELNLEDASLLDLDQDEDDGDDKDNDEEDEEDIYGKKNKSISLDALTEDEEESLEDEDSEDQSSRKSSTGLDIEADNARDKDDSGSNNELDLEKDNKSDEEDEDLDSEELDAKRNSLDLLNMDLEGEEKEKSDLEDDHSGEFGRKKVDMGMDVDADNDNKKSAHTENIQTHYNSKKSLRHDEYDWDIDHEKKRKVAPEEEKKKKNTMEISFAEKKDLGEQTIDYSKLHEEFGGITIDRLGNKDTREGPKYHRDEDPEKEFSKGIYDNEEFDEFGNIVKSDLEEEEKQNDIFLPNPNGIDQAVNILNMYYNKQTKEEDIYRYIANLIKNEFGATTYFLYLDRNKAIYIDKYVSPLANSSELELKDLTMSWEEEKKDRLQDWIAFNLPTWSDITFQSNELEFVYPYFEGINSMGLAVVKFSSVLDESKAKTIEVYLEMARGFYLENYHETGGQSNYTKGVTNQTQKKEGMKGKVKGFFGKLFGKKAA